MASLSFSHFLTFPSFLPRRHKCHQHLQLHLQHPLQLSRFRAFSISKPRRKVKTNAELCDDIREFITANGLPEGFVPTMKDFSQLGRSDLAFIVRRRGYKLIGELLGNKEETSFGGDGDGDDKISGQYEKARSFTVDCSSSSVEVSDSIVIGSDIDSDDDDSHVAVENLSGMENGLPGMVEDEDGILKSQLSVVEIHVDSLDGEPPFDSSNDSQDIPVETNSIGDSSVDLEASSDLSSLDIDVAEDGFPDENGLTSSGTNLSAESSRNGLNDVVSSSEAFVNEPLPDSLNINQSHISDEHIEAPLELSSMSLEDKVASFMRHGHLDSLEGERNVERIDEVEVQAVNSIAAHTENEQNGGQTNMYFNGGAIKSMQVVNAMTESYPLSDTSSLVEEQDNQFNKDSDDKTSKRDNNVEINHLRFMLHEKELELSRLKEQIEKEKRALSLLQAKAETEISKAQQLISEKDAELLAAEEMLSELVEVQIQYHGDGELVEVAGSFNGWHHWIKMDPQPSSSASDPVGSRKSKLWSTILWLYPGIYEIKFIVDGEWRIDPHMESISNGAMSNNILRVRR